LTSYSDEIDLRAYIDVLWRWRWFLVVVVLVAGLTAGILSFFVLTPVYEASVQIMVPKDPLPAEIILSPSFLQRIIEELDLPEDKYTPFTLNESITVEPSKASSSLTTLKVQNSDPNLATSIADTIAKDFLAFVRDKNIEAISSSVSYLQAQKATASSQLAKQRSERDAIRQSGRVEALQREGDRLWSRVSDYRSQLSSGQVRENELLKGMAELEGLIAVTPEKVDGPPDWSGHVTKIPNETYQRYEQSLGFKKVELSELKVRLEEIKALLPTFESEYADAYSRLVSLQRTLQDLDTNIGELTAQISTLESRMNQLSMSLPQTSLVGQAITPENPIRPRKLLNTAVASVLGGFVSVFAVFFIEYWRSPRKDAKAY
jgi:capsular polysaccharide biosynthesis protein